MSHAEAGGSPSISVVPTQLSDRSLEVDANHRVSLIRSLLYALMAAGPLVCPASSDAGTSPVLREPITFSVDKQLPKVEADIGGILFHHDMRMNGLEQGKRLSYTEFESFLITTFQAGTESAFVSNGGTVSFFCKNRFKRVEDF